MENLFLSVKDAKEHEENFAEAQASAHAVFRHEFFKVFFAPLCALRG
jgi:hypothetical protein